MFLWWFSTILNQVNPIWWRLNWVFHLHNCHDQSWRPPSFAPSTLLKLYEFARRYVWINDRVTKNAGKLMWNPQEVWVPVHKAPCFRKQTTPGEHIISTTRGGEHQQMFFLTARASVVVVLIGQWPCYCFGKPWLHLWFVDGCFIVS